FAVGGRGRPAAPGARRVPPGAFAQSRVAAVRAMSETPDMDAQTEPDERELAERLLSQRPVPGAEFRGSLGRYLVANDPGFGPRPERLLAIVGAYLGAGGLLLALGL